MEVVATGLGDRTMVTTSWSPLFSAPAGGSWAVMTPTVASSRGTLPLTDTVMLASSARVRASSSVRPITSGAALSPRKTRKVAAASATIRRTVATGMIRAAGPPLRRPGPTLLILIRAGLMASPVVLAESPEGILRPPSAPPFFAGTGVSPLVPSFTSCLLYTSDAADDLTRVDLGGRRIIKKKKKQNNNIT